MRKATKEEFLAMPKGTLCFLAPNAEGEYKETSGLRIKGKNVFNIDFFYTPLDSPYLYLDEMVEV